MQIYDAIALYGSYDRDSVWPVCKHDSIDGVVLARKLTLWTLICLTRVYKWVGERDWETKGLNCHCLCLFRHEAWVNSHWHHYQEVVEQSNPITKMKTEQRQGQWMQFKQKRKKSQLRISLSNKPSVHSHTEHSFWQQKMTGVRFTVQHTQLSEEGWQTHFIFHDR